MDKDSSRKRKSIDPLNTDDASNCSKKVYKSATKDEEIIGIPSEKLEEYKRIRRIKEFYPWQLEFMNDPRLINGENALLTAETGGGKTLVAELLIIRTMVTKGCSAILALPYVALVSEKVPIFKALSEVFDITVKEYAGLIHTYPIPPPNNTLYICSYEFATIVCTRLKEADQLKEIKLLVLDEIHMVGEALRGANVEMLLAGYRILIEDQIIAMSATVGNIQQLTKWVAGFHYHSPLRPVPLQEHIVYSGRVLSVKGDQLAIERVLNPQLPWYSELAFEIVPEHSVLMFCNSRKACEDTCSILCRTVPRQV
uniref:Helicase ATP-binding domain-containing protein n=1 Tax=Panagrolaimus davidi TaxID=227884 RepID=A0A914P664_9BILA